MAKVLFIIAQKNFREEELKEPLQVLKEGGYGAAIAADSTKIAEGMLGLQVQPDMSFSEAFRCLNEFSAVVVVGGSGAVSLANNSYVVRILKNADLSGKVIGAICLGPVVLARAGVITGRRAVVYYSAPDAESIKALRAGGAVFTDKKIVEDGRIITAYGPQQSTEFAKVLLKKLG